jgi:hypothetical protein
MAAIEQEIIIIRTCLANWVAQVKLANAVNYYDINRISEGSVMHLLNLLYGYALEDLNREQSNFPGIDLGDRGKAGLAIQVTSRTDAGKLLATLRTFSSSGYAASFPNGLRLLIISDRKQWRISRGKLQPYTDIFGLKNHVWFISDLLADIQDAYYRDPELFHKVKAFLQKEFGAIGSSSPISPSNTADQLKFFRHLYQATHEQAAKRFVDFSCLVNNTAIPTEQLNQCLTNTSVIVLAGASGYGKTLLAKRLTLDWLETGLPLFLRAKYYETNLDTLLNKEATIYGFTNGSEWLVIAQSTGLVPWLVIDGLNECSEEWRCKLIAEVEQLISTRSVRVMITTQAITDQIKQLNPAIVSIRSPEQKTKHAIAALYSGKPINKKVETVLNVVNTNIEAQMVGEIGADDIEQVSRFRVFELFVRRKLAALHAEGLRLLSGIAAELSDKLLSHLPERFVTELMRKEGIRNEVLEHCLLTGLLDNRLGMFSFGHELFLNFFIADSIVAGAQDINLLLKEVNAPKNQDNLLLIIGAIADTELLSKLLPELTDTEVFISLWNGEGGVFSQQWTDRQLRQTLTKITKEIKGSEFELSSNSISQANFRADALHQWTHNEYALVYTISGLLVQGAFLKEFFELVGDQDEKCNSEYKRLFEDAKSKKFGLRTALFSATYIGVGSKEAGITKIFSDLYSGMATFNRPRSVTIAMINPLIKKHSLQYGEFYLLLLLLRWSDELHVLYPFILSALQKHWRILPYHLTNEILDQAPHSYSNEEQRQTLVDALNQMHNDTQNVWLSTSIFEALSRLGALADDAEAYIETVQTEMASILSAPDNEESPDKAAGLYYAQFDHPYDIAYQKVIDQLEEPQKQSFYMLALQGYHSSIFTITLIRSAWELYGSKIAPHLLRWTETPFIEVSFPQDSLAIFFVSHLLLAKSGYALGSKLNEANDAKNQSLFAAAELFYCLNRKDMEVSDRLEAALVAKQALFDAKNSYIIETIWQSRHSLHNTGIYHNVDAASLMIITTTYREEMVEACRKAILTPGGQLDVMNLPREDEVPIHAIDLLAECGNLIDLDILKPLVNNAIYGRAAVRAIKKLN